MTNHNFSCVTVSRKGHLSCDLWTSVCSAKAEMFSVGRIKTRLQAGHKVSRSSLCAQKLPWAQERERHNICTDIPLKWDLRMGEN